MLSVSVAQFLKQLVDFQAIWLLDVTLTSQLSNFLQSVTACRTYEILRCDTHHRHLIVQIQK